MQNFLIRSCIMSLERYLSISHKQDKVKINTRSVAPSVRHIKIDTRRVTPSV